MIRHLKSTRLGQYSLYSVVAVAFTVSAATTPVQCFDAQGNIILTPQELAYLTQDLGIGCNILATLDPSIRANFNGNVQKSLGVLEQACPPNPPPTNLVVIAGDILVAVEVLAPYVRTAAQRAAVANAKSIAAAHGVTVPQ